MSEEEYLEWRRNRIIGFRMFWLLYYLILFMPIILGLANEVFSR